MKVRRQVTFRTCGIQLLCASLLIHNFVGAAPPQGLLNGARFTPDQHKIFNDINDLSGHSGLVVPAVQLRGPSFIPPSEPTVFISQPQEPKISISQPLQTFQPPEPTISFSQTQSTNRNSLPANSPAPQQALFINQQPPANDFINSQPVAQAQQPEFIFRSQPLRNPPQQQNFVNSQPVTPTQQQEFISRSQPSRNPPQQQNFINSQPVAPAQQQQFISRSQPSINPPQQQNSFNSQPFLVRAVQESATLIRDGETVLLPHESVSVGSSINQVQPVNEINSLSRPIASTGGESPLLSLFPEEKVVELPIPFLRHSASISVGPVPGNTVNQNQLQQNHNSVQPQTTSVFSSAKNLNSVNSINTVADSFVKRGPQHLGLLENTFTVGAPSGGSNTIGIPLPSGGSNNNNIGIPLPSGGSNNIGIPLPSGGSNNIGIPLSSVVNSIVGNSNAGVPISSTINSDDGNNNIGTPKATLSNTVSEVPLSSTINSDDGNNNIGTPKATLSNTVSEVPLTSAANVASEDNTLRSSQSPIDSVGVSLSSVINSVSSATDTNTGGDIGSLTLGEVLLSMNGQDGIIVLPMDSLQGSTVSELMGTNDNQNITFRADDGSSDGGDLGALLDTFIADYGDPDYIEEEVAPAPPSPPNLFRGTLADTLFVKGQWLGTLLGGLVDIGGAITGQLKELKPKS